MRIAPILLGVALLLPLAAAGAAEPLALRLAEETLPLESMRPRPEPAEGVGPGSRIVVHHADASVICTASFLWQDVDGRILLGTAGHCLLAEDASPEPRLAPDPSLGAAWVCVDACDQAGLLDDVLPPDLRPLGETVFAISGGIGSDFGLVEVPPALHALLRFDVPVWGPVTASQPESFERAPVGLYGMGFGVGEAWPTMGRPGVGILMLEWSWAAALPANVGDSGAPLVTLEVDERGAQAHAPVGIVTHGGPGLAFGTNLERARLLAAESGLYVAPLFKKF